MMSIRRLGAVIALCVGLASPLGAEAAFVADFELQRSADPTGAIVRGRLTYDAAGRRLRYDYTDRDYVEIVRFDGGTDAASGVRYQVGEHCTGGCRAVPAGHALPLYEADPAVYRPMGVDPATGCALYQPLDPFGTPLVTVSFADDGSPCTALWGDGSFYQFSNVSNVDPSEPGLFDEPADCRNADRLDLVVLFDRSASVSSATFDRARTWVLETLDGLAISPSQANVAIGLFDVATEAVVGFHEGTSRSNVEAGLAAMSCSCGDALDPLLRPREIPRSASPTCCGRRTSLARAVEDASAMFSSSGRDDEPLLGVTTRRIVLLVTDGRSNTLRDAATPCKGRACRDDLAAAMEQLRQRHTTAEVRAAHVRPGKTRLFAFDAQGKRTRVERVLEPVARCSAVDWCDPSTCGGLCECAQCTAPSACRPSGNYCFENTIVPGGKVCELVPYDCARDFPSRCDNPFCDPVDQRCETRPVVCPPSGNPGCFVRSCLPTTGECVSDILPDPTCTDECLLDSECNDDNACTIDRCVPTDTLRVCKFIPRICDDGDPCTQDYCTDRTVGCQARPQPSTFCDDDVSCTIDTCVPEEGCSHEPLPCDDGQSCTTDVCDETSGYCSNRDTAVQCPAGLTPALGHCWTVSHVVLSTGRCDDACAALGLEYDPATATVAGSEGTDANCSFVLGAMGMWADLQFPSATCATGGGCFWDIGLGDTPDIPVGGGRCAEPPTEAGARVEGRNRLCACR